MQEKTKKTFTDEELLSFFKSRCRIINCIYQYELFNKKIDSKEIFENYDLKDKEIRIIEHIEKNYDLFKKLICCTLDETWTWERLNPHLRAILIYGTYEVIAEKPILAINEMINITKIYFIGTEYKLVNKVLDRISKISFGSNEENTNKNN